MTPLAYESHSLTPDRHRLDTIERTALGILTLGLLAILAGLFFAKATTPDGTRAVWLTGAWSAVIGGGILYALRKHGRDLPGIRNHGIVTNSLTARGAIGWMFGIALTAFYCAIYWAPWTLTGWMRLHDPFSIAVSELDVQSAVDLDRVPEIQFDYLYICGHANKRPLLAIRSDRKVEHYC